MWFETGVKNPYPESGKGRTGRDPAERPGPEWCFKSSGGNMRQQRKPKITFGALLIWPFKSYIRIMIVVIFVALFQYQSIQIDILAREIRALEVKKNLLHNESTSLQAQIDRLTHINRVEKLANERFGLVAPGKKIDQIYVKKFERLPLEREKELKLAGVQ